MVQLFAVVIGSLFTAVGLLFVHAGLPRTATLVCDRSPSQQIYCHQQETIAGIPTHHQRLEDVQSIQLQSFQVPVGDGDIDAPRHQIILSGSQGTLSFGLTSNAQELQPTLTKLKQFQAAASPNSITIYGFCRKNKLKVESLPSLFLSSPCLLPPCSNGGTFCLKSFCSTSGGTAVIP